MHELRITNQVIYLNPPIEECRYKLYQEMFAWKMVVLSLPRIQSQRYQVSSATPSLWDSTSTRLFTELLTRPFKLQTSARRSEGKLEEALCDLTFFLVVTFPHSRVWSSGVIGVLEIPSVNFFGNFNSCFSLPTLPLAFYYGNLQTYTKAEGII